jgi:superfamily II DNA helicase RecQ
LLPAVLDHSTPLEDIAKCLLYFDSENACRLIVQSLRKCLPPHLRSCVHAFSSDLSEKGKQQCWGHFKKGEIRILCATDAAGMGCDVPDVQYVVTFQIPKSLSTVGQRWGRAGRDRTTQGVCILLVPKWAFRPDDANVPSTLNTAVQNLQRGRTGRKVPGAESKRDTIKRAKLDNKLEAFVNVKHPGQLFFYLRFHSIDSFP